MLSIAQCQKRMRFPLSSLLSYNQRTFPVATITLGGISWYRESAIYATGWECQPISSLTLIKGCRIIRALLLIDHCHYWNLTLSVNGSADPDSDARSSWDRLCNHRVSLCRILVKRRASSFVVCCPSCRARRAWIDTDADAICAESVEMQLYLLLHQ
jgi:hypothetical protein